MSFERTPEQFMKGVFIAPHYFSDPQSQSHGQYVHMQLKDDLYNDILNKIVNLQFTSDQKQWIKLQAIKKCQGEDNKLSAFLQRGKNNKIQQEILTCQDWTVSVHRNNSKIDVKYRVKAYQTCNDIFYTQIYPPTLWKQIKNYIFNPL